MSFRSMIQEMKGEVGAISRRGVGSRSSVRVRRVAAVLPAEATRQSCWAQLPPELLREVLARVEESEARWPRRRDAVACAGVCRSWRVVVREIVCTPEASGKLTFPISLKQFCRVQMMVCSKMDRLLPPINIFIRVKMKMTGFVGQCRVRLVAERIESHDLLAVADGIKAEAECCVRLSTTGCASRHEG